MLVTFTPDGGDRREWEFDPDDAWSFEAEMIESVGRPYWVSYEGDFLSLLQAGNSRARRALLWVLLRRDNPELRFADLAVKVREVTLGMDRREVAALRARVAAGEFAGAELAAAEEMLAGYPDDEDQAEGEPGKDEPGDSSTASP